MNSSTIRSFSLKLFYSRRQYICCTYTINGNNLIIVAFQKDWYIRLELARSIQESIQAVQQGKPLLYHIYFSSHEPIPTLSAIWFNNQKYCPSE